MSESRYQLDPERARWRMVDGEVVVLHLETSYYYGLNGAGSYLWQCLEESPRSLPELAAALAQRYDLGEDQAATDALLWLEHVLAEGLVKPQIAATAQSFKKQGEFS